jgi:hypothetical protein
MSKSDRGVINYFSAAVSAVRSDRAQGYADAYERLPMSGVSAAYREGYEACQRTLAGFVYSKAKTVVSQPPRMELF